MKHSKGSFENVRLIDSMYVGLEFSAKPSFFPYQQKGHSLSVGFNLRNQNSTEYRAFLNHLIEKEYSKEIEFDLVVDRITSREDDRSIVNLNQRLLKIEDIIYCHVTYINKNGALTGKFRTYVTRIDSKSTPLEIDEGDFLIGTVDIIDPLHRSVNVVPIEIVTQEEFKVNKNRIHRASS